MLIQIPGLDIPSSIPADSIAGKAQEELSMLKSLSFDDLINKLAKDTVQFAISLTIAILVFYIGKFIIRKIYKIVQTVMIRRKVDRSLTTFILSLVRILLYFILIVTVIGILGIETSSFIAIFASAGVAIGMALSGTLQNFAGGVLILLLKPYKIGDYIETQGFAGTVTEIQIFNTIICTPDNKSIIIPNGGLSTGSINNWSREDYRRIDWSVAISYGDNVDDARKAILQMFNDDPDIVKTTVAAHRVATARAEALENAEENAADTNEEEHHNWLYRLFHRSRRHVEDRLQQLDKPLETPRVVRFDDVERKPVVLLGNLGDSSVDLTIRAWVPSHLYWNVFFRYNERFYKELPNAGVSFPFPQLDVHVANPQA